MLYYCWHHSEKMKIYIIFSIW